ncbi:MAG: response regulator [Maricaulaceae bacterium]|nr:response regulator [Maricaulaceae bacterium]
MNSEIGPVPPAVENLTVVIVDDNAALRGALRAALSAMGCARVVEAESGEAALNVIAVEHVDLVMTDWKMRGMDGLELARLLRADQAGAAIPLVMLTAYDEDSRRQTAHAAGVDRFIVKPFTAKALAYGVAAAARGGAARRGANARENAQFSAQGA